MEYPEDKLREGEVYWRDRYDWLLESGYALRPRYRPGWVPSWKATDGYPPRFEDGWLPQVRRSKVTWDTILIEG